MSRFVPDHSGSDHPSPHAWRHSPHRQSGHLLRDSHSAAALAHKLVLIDIEARHRLAWHRSHFNPDQPRVPAGHPDGGQWTNEGKPEATSEPRVISDATPDNAWEPGARYAQNDTHRSGRDRADGHHFVHQSLFRRLRLPPETLKVFKEAKTGRLYGDGNKYDAPHRIYNEAVEEHFYRFITTHGIEIGRMTPDQARSFVNEVKESRDPRIRHFNIRMKLLEVLYRYRRVLRRND